MMPSINNIQKLHPTCQLCGAYPEHRFSHIYLQGFRGVRCDDVSLCDLHFTHWLECRSLRMGNDELESALTTLLGDGPK